MRILFRKIILSYAYILSLLLIGLASIFIWTTVKSMDRKTTEV